MVAVSMKQVRDCLCNFKRESAAAWLWTLVVTVLSKEYYSGVLDRRWREVKRSLEAN